MGGPRFWIHLADNTYHIFEIPSRPALFKVQKCMMGVNQFIKASQLNMHQSPALRPNNFFIP